MKSGFIWMLIHITAHYISHKKLLRDDSNTIVLYSKIKMFQFSNFPPYLTNERIFASFHFTTFSFSKKEYIPCIEKRTPKSLNWRNIFMMLRSSELYINFIVDFLKVPYIIIIKFSTFSKTEICTNEIHSTIVNLLCI